MAIVPAILGGVPSFPRAARTGTPNVGDTGRFFERLSSALTSRRLSNDGPLVQRFEAEIARRTGVEHAIAVCNATIGLELVAHALGLRGEVIVPAFTFSATAQAMAWIGIAPVFVDVDPEGHSIDPAQVEAAISPRTSAILGVHLWGRVCDVDALAEIAARRQLRLFFDAAHAFACTRAGRPVGGFGDAEVFSFHATKFVNAFEGGAITTNDGALAARLRGMRSFGASTEGEPLLGTNAKMSEAAAAMGVTSLEIMERVVEINRSNLAAYRDALSGTPGLRVGPIYPDGDSSNCQYVVLEVDAEVSGLSADELTESLAHDGVFPRRYFVPSCHQLPIFRDARRSRETLPISERLSKQVLCLPTGISMSPTDVERVALLIRALVADAARVRAELRAGSQRKGRS